DGTTVIDDTTNIGGPGNPVMSSDDHLLYIWNQTQGKWLYSSYGNEQQIPARDVSNTTLANFDAYADNIMKANDRATKIDVYDSLGNVYTLETVFRKVMDVPADPTASPPTGAEAEWDWYSYYVDSDGKPIPEYGVGAGTLVFGDDGLLKRTYYYDPDDIRELKAGNLSTIEYIEVNIDAEGVPKDEYGNAITGKVGADFNTVGAQGQVVTNGGIQTYVPNFISLDFLGYSIGKQLDIAKEPIDGVTQFGARTSTTGYYQDGYAMGLLQNWSVSQTGVITGSYSNGKTLPIAQVALAMFANDQGLLKVGETCFAETTNSGLAQIGTPLEGGAGSVIGNTVEMSNVDLSEEFVSLIRAQRGFQANARVVTTSDQVLEELINLKR
ncbi:MAG: flagellar hook-basal body complex protein, partial [Synergistaceae bacterium]|nr:flagellar hook-basal body complex protein [Synergistaceae bacterium]